MKEDKIEKYGEQTRIFKILKEAIPYVVIILVVVFIRTFIVTPVKVNGSSMYPYLKGGEILILNKLDRSYHRFDIVVVNVNGTKIIKRVIGLPEESISYQNCKLYINDEEVEDFVTSCITDDFDRVFIPKGYYFVMGDNRQNSSDSRDYRVGLISKSQIEGTTSLRLYPFNRFGILK